MTQTTAATAGDGSTAPRERGAALISTLLAIGFLVMIGALASNQARTGFLIQQRAREGLEASIAAETGLAAAIADFDYEPRFERFDLGNGATFPYSGHAVDGPLPSSFHVEVRLRKTSATHIDIISTSLGRNRAQRRLIATVERSDRPFVPAAFFSAAAQPVTSAGDGLRIDGNESKRGAAPAIAMTTDEVARTALQNLLAGGATLTGRPVAASTDWSGLDESIALIRSLAAKRQLPTEANGPYPEATWVSSASVMVSSASGSGIWLIDGDFRVAGDFEFEGLLLVVGDIFFENTSRVRILGALVQARPGEVLRATGDATIRYDADALARVESQDPEIIGHRAEIIGWRDAG